MAHEDDGAKHLVQLLGRGGIEDVVDLAPAVAIEYVQSLTFIMT
jgi:hypothetical protein